MSNVKRDNNTKTCYNTYKESVEKELQVSYSDYMKVLKAFNNKVKEEIIYNASEITLPCNLGRVRIKKFKNKMNPNKLSPNWRATLDLWERNPEAKEKKTLVYHLNEHRKGHAYRVFWDKKISKVRHHSYYTFKPVREFKRELAKVLLTNTKIDYYL